MATKRKILVIHSQQPANQYAGGGTGVNDSEQYWMRKLAEEIVSQLRTTGHEIKLGPTGTASSTYAENVAWAKKAENADADLLISCHSNASTDHAHNKGIGVYHHPNSTKGKAFAAALLPFLKPASASGRVYQSTIKVAEVASTKPPAVLVEHEYHDWTGTATTGGAEWIRNAANRTALAKAYRAFVVAQFGDLSTPAPTPTPDPPTKMSTTEIHGRLLADLEKGQGKRASLLKAYADNGSTADAPKWAAFLASADPLLADLVLDYGVTSAMKAAEVDDLVLVVLGSALNTDGTMKAKFKRRLDVALAALAHLPRAKVLVSGGAPKNGKTEAEVGRAYLISKGISSGRIITEAKSGSTVGNARYSMALLNGKYAHYVLVSDSSHLRRAALLFDSAQLEVETAGTGARSIGLQRVGLLAYKESAKDEGKASAAEAYSCVYYSALLLGCVTPYEAARR